MEFTKCKICNSIIKVDSKISNKEKKECLCIECLKSQCIFKGRNYNVSTHTACHCNSIRPPVYRLIGNKEVCICYSHWKNMFCKECIVCSTRRNVKVYIDGMPYCEQCKIDEDKHCRDVMNMLEDVLYKDVLYRIIKKVKA